MSDGGATLSYTMPASIYKSPRGRAEVLRLYDEAVARLGVEHEDLTVGTRLGDTHVLAIGPRTPLLFLPGGNFLNLTCLGWFLPWRTLTVSTRRTSSASRAGARRRGPRRRGTATPSGWRTSSTESAYARGSHSSAFPTALVSPSGPWAWPPERISRAVLVSPAGIAAGPLWRMLVGVGAPMLLYRLRPTEDYLLRAARALLTEPEDPAFGPAVRQLGAIYWHSGWMPACPGWPPRMSSEDSGVRWRCSPLRRMRFSPLGRSFRGPGRSSPTSPRPSPSEAAATSPRRRDSSA